MNGLEAVPFEVPQVLREGVLVFHGKAYYVIGRKVLPDAIVDDLEGLVIPGMSILYLRCATQPRICKCKATVEDLGNGEFGGFTITEGSEHTPECPWSPVRICRDFYKDKMYAKLRNREFKDPKAAYTWARDSFVQHYPDHPAIFPGFSASVRSTAYRIVAAHYPVLPTRENLHEMVIPPRLVVAPNRNDAPLLLFQHSYQGEDGKWEVIVVLGSRFMFELWCKGQATFCDGTFKTCPDPFKQLYVLHTVVFGTVRPALMVLMTRKNTEAYAVLFSRLRDMAVELGHPIEWVQFHCDFESAVVNTIEELFPEAEVLGCWFHFVSAIFKKMKTKIANVTAAYADETTGVKTAVKQCFALAFVNPEGDRPLNTLIAIMQEYFALPPMDPPRPNLVPLFVYIYESWILGHVQLPSVWSVFRVDNHRTNNGVEGYNRAMLEIFGTTLTLWKWFEAYQQEEHRIVQDVIALADGRPGPKQKKKYENRDDRLRFLKVQYLHDILTDFQYVKSLRHAMPY